MVDGKEFFGSDPQIATQNLPADAVDKVQVFDKKSDMAEFSGIDDGNEQKTINLSLKEDKKNGYFGNAMGGYGTEDRFEAKANINRFGSKMQISGIGMANNTNQQGFSIEDYIQFMGGLGNLMRGGGGRIELSFDDAGGLPLGMNLQNGFVTTLAGGINLNAELGKKTELSSSYFYNYLNNQTERSLERENFLDSGSFFNTENSKQENRNNNHRLNLNLEHKIDTSMNLLLRGNIGFNDGKSSSIGINEAMTSEGILENRSETDYLSEAMGLNWDANLTYRWRIRKPGRTLVANLSSGMNNIDRQGSIYSLNTFPLLAVTDTLDQRQTELNQRVNFGGRVSYTEPIGKGKYLEWNYSRQNYNNDLQKDFYDRKGETEIRNTDLSNHFLQDYIYDRTGINFRWNLKKLNLTTGISLQQSQLSGELLTQNEEVSTSFRNWLPSLRARYEMAATRSIRFDYTTRVREPSLEQLQPIVDNSDPLNIYIGNPNLRPAYSHSMDLEFMSFSQFSYTSVFAALNATYTRDRIVNARSVDELLRQTIQPVNVENDYQLGGFLSFGTPIRPIKTRININTDIQYNRGISWINEIENQTETWQNMAELSLENRKKEKLDWMIGGQVIYNTTSYSISAALDQSFLQQKYFADVTWDITEKWSVSTSLDYQIYSGAAFAENQEVPIWRASVSRYILKDNKGMIRLSAVDLLNRNLGVNRVAELNYVQEETIRSLGRYFMLSFTYSLSGFNGSQGGGIHIRRR